MESIRTLLNEAGVIGQILLGLNTLGYGILVWKLIMFFQFQIKERPQVVAGIGSDTKAHWAEHGHLVEVVQSELQLASLPLRRGLTTVENIATVAPLLGLLGTVIGIYEAFGIIATHGLSNPALFADGIKMALTTTVIGLLVAIPHIIGFNYLQSRLEEMLASMQNEILRIMDKHLFAQTQPKPL